jgi:hypothetical protein
VSLPLRARFQLWRVSEIFLWPMILFGAGTLFLDQESSWGLGAHAGFRVLSFVYSLHGLAILSVTLDRFGLFGLIRTLAFVLFLFPLAPALLAVGFFDQWFDIRSRLRQS